FFIVVRVCAPARGAAARHTRTAVVHFQRRRMAYLLCREAAAVRVSRVRIGLTLPDPSYGKENEAPGRFFREKAKKYPGAARPDFALDGSGQVGTLPHLFVRKSTRTGPAAAGGRGPCAGAWWCWRRGRLAWSWSCPARRSRPARRTTSRRCRWWA